MYSIDIIVLDTTKGPLEPGLGGVRRFDVHIILVTLVSRSKRGPRGSDGQK
jgi:hypothetical protein